MEIVSIIAIVLSPLIAIGVTLLFNKKSAKRKDKLDIFKVLMAKRYNTANINYVEALNSIDVIFYNSPKVIEAWNDYYNSLLKITSSTVDQVIDKEVKLVETIAKNLGYKNLNWEKIKKSYTPKWLADDMKGNEEYKQCQLEIMRNATSQMKAQNTLSKNDN